MFCSAVCLYDGNGAGEQCPVKATHWGLVSLTSCWCWQCKRRLTRRRRAWRHPKCSQVLASFLSTVLWTTTLSSVGDVRVDQTLSLKLFLFYVSINSCWNIWLLNIYLSVVPTCFTSFFLSFSHLIEKKPEILDKNTHKASCFTQSWGAAGGLPSASSHFPSLSRQPVNCQTRVLCLWKLRLVNTRQEMHHFIYQCFFDDAGGRSFWVQGGLPISSSSSSTFSSSILFTFFSFK